MVPDVFQVSSDVTCPKELRHKNGEYYNNLEERISTGKYTDRKKPRMGKAKSENREEKVSSKINSKINKQEKKNPEAEIENVEAETEIQREKEEEINES